MKRRDILVLLGSSVFLIVAWVAFSIIHQLVSSTINESVNQSISPIEPNFDISVINSLKTRIKIAPDFATFNSTAAATPTPIPVPTIPVASPSAIPSLSLFAPSPTATPGGATH